ncbi:PREDICTED: uncharacterized protein LOC108770955 [Trachymyrmex cornetzi]|uniref:uncharacterized protein LOC108770955 n=1 Tax=Trachymyrmex cornetzi TaxID=471704 RepID=UPI00084F3A36|nr:PREDICTED: uncharacterized protein LOC108770955 [Trachymyrmex cornetzi]
MKSARARRTPDVSPMTGYDGVRGRAPTRDRGHHADDDDDDDDDGASLLLLPSPSCTNLGARISYSLDLPIHAAPVCLAAEDIGPVLVRKGEHFGAPAGAALGF